MEIAIEVKELTKNYGEIIAVNHINFEVRKGEIFGFLGPNGAGKTTTIRMLTGLSRPTTGTARVLGFNVESEIVKAKKYMGVVPEASNLYDELSAFAICCLWRSYTGFLVINAKQGWKSF